MIIHVLKNLFAFRWHNHDFDYARISDLAENLGLVVVNWYKVVYRPLDCGDEYGGSPVDCGNETAGNGKVYDCGEAA